MQPFATQSTLFVLPVLQIQHGLSTQIQLFSGPPLAQDSSVPSAMFCRREGCPPPATFPRPTRMLHPHPPQHHAGFPPQLERREQPGALPQIRIQRVIPCICRCLEKEMGTVKHSVRTSKWHKTTPCRKPWSLLPFPWIK